MVAQNANSVADDLGRDVPARRQEMVRRDPYMHSSRPGGARDPQIRRAPAASGLYDVLDLILDKGIVVDAFVRVSLVGIELLTVDLRVVIASVDTYLRYAEGIERLQVTERSRAAKLPDVVGGGMKKHAIKQGAERIGKAIGGKNRDDDDDDDEDDDDQHVGGKLANGVRGVLSKGVGRIVGRLAGDDRYEDSDESEDDRQDKGERHHHGQRDRAEGQGGNDRGGRKLPRREPQPQRKRERQGAGR